jgi:transcriptional regulator
VDDPKLDLPQGTLDLLILKALSLEPTHGWAIGQRIQQVSRETLQIPQGSLYPALHRMSQDGWLKSECGTTEKNREARFYTITAAGRRQLEAEEESWARVRDGVQRLLRFA